MIDSIAFKQITSKHKGFVTQTNEQLSVLIGISMGLLSKHDLHSTDLGVREQCDNPF